MNNEIYGTGGQNQDLIWDSFITQNKITKYMPQKRYVESLCFKLNIMLIT